MQLGTCAVVIKFKTIKKRCVYFVVPGNGQVLLEMPDTAALKIIILNIDSIQVEVAECKTNTKWEMHVVAKACTNTDRGVKTKQDANDQNSQSNANKSINYLFSSSNVDEDKRKSSDMMQKIHDTFGDVFNGIGCFEGTFSLQLFALQQPFKEELKHLQKMDIITPLGVDEMAECCNSFVLVPKADGKVRLGLDPAWLNQALIRPIHRGLTLNDILPRLNNVKYMSIINVSSGYHNLQLDTQLSYLTTFECLFGRYRYKCLPFGTAPAGNMFQCKIDENL